jgi:hypothetical protein
VHLGQEKTCQVLISKINLLTTHSSLRSFALRHFLELCPVFAYSFLFVTASFVGSNQDVIGDRPDNNQDDVYTTISVNASYSLDNHYLLYIFYDANDVA